MSFAVVASAGLFAAACAGTLKPGAFTWHRETLNAANAHVSLTLARPTTANPPPFLVIFASGDGGLRGTSKAVLQHFADRGYWVAGFSSPDAFEVAIKASGASPNYVATRDAFASIVGFAKRSLGLPDQTPVVVTGMSRGANVVIAAAGDPVLKPGLVGAVAIALTREFDELTVSDRAKQLPGVELDEKGRIKTRPAIQRLGSLPLAIIQSTNDSYVPSAEWRRSLGPDTDTRRLYEVPSRNHSFGGGEDALMRDLDAAMKWIEGINGSARRRH